MNLFAWIRKLSARWAKEAAEKARNDGRAWALSQLNAGTSPEAIEAKLDWLPPRSFDTGAMDVLGGWRKCRSCDKWVAPKYGCDYDCPGSSK